MTDLSIVSPGLLPAPNQVPDPLFARVLRRLAGSLSANFVILLIVLAGLELQWEADRTANANLFANWNTVLLWTEASRYEKKSQTDAEALYDAITQNPDGVFLWIQNHW